MPNKRKPRKHKRAGKAVSTKRKTHKKSRRSKVKGGGSTKNLKENPFYINIVNSDDEEWGEQGFFHRNNQSNDNPEPSLQSKAGMGIGAVALVGGAVTLLMLTQ